MDDLVSLLPVRTAADSLRGIARFELGGQEAILPTIPIEASERWLIGIDGQLSALLSGLNASDDVTGSLRLLASQTPALLELLKSYDQSDLLPSVEEIRRTARPHEVLLAVLSIWRAANPLVDIALMALATSGTSSVPTSLRRPNGAGLATTSDAASPPSSSSATSTPPVTASGTITNRASRRSAPGRSSPTTRGHTSAGGPGSPPAVLP